MTYDLLLSISESRSSDNYTIILLAPSLDLTPSLSSTIGATLVVGVDLGVRRNTIESLSKSLSDSGHLTQGLVPKHYQKYQWLDKPAHPLKRLRGTCLS